MAKSAFLTSKIQFADPKFYFVIWNIGLSWNEFLKFFSGSEILSNLGWFILEVCAVKFKRFWFQLARMNIS